MFRRPPSHVFAVWLLLAAAALGWGVRALAAIEGNRPLTCCGTRGQCPMHPRGPCPKAALADCPCGVTPAPAPVAPAPPLPFCEAPAARPVRLSDPAPAVTRWLPVPALPAPAPAFRLRRPPRG